MAEQLHCLSMILSLSHCVCVSLHVKYKYSASAPQRPLCWSQSWCNGRAATFRSWQILNGNRNSWGLNESWGNAAWISSANVMALVERDECTKFVAQDKIMSCVTNELSYFTQVNFVARAKWRSGVNVLALYKNSLWPAEYWFPLKDKCLLSPFWAAVETHEVLKSCSWNSGRLVCLDLT